MQFTPNPNRSDRHFQDLMLHRVHDILLVASPYDAFILEQDGRLSEQILTEFKGMNLSYAPRIWSAHTAKKALEMIKKRSYDLIIVMLRISDMSPISFAQKIKEKYLENGSFYIFSPHIIKKHNCRLGGKIGTYVMDDYKIMQIDELEDFELCEVIMRGYGIDKNE